MVKNMNTSVEMPLQTTSGYMRMALKRPIVLLEQDDWCRRTGQPFLNDANYVATEKKCSMPKWKQH